MILSMLILAVGAACQLVAGNECFDCKFLNRDGDCAKNLDDCRECLPGYEEVLVTLGSNRVAKCKLKPKMKKLVGVCNEDSDCSNDQYCFNNHCSQCFDCYLFKRFPKKGCAKHPSECGPCLNGYFEELVTLNTNSKPCIKEKHVSYSGYQQEKYETAGASVGIVAVLSVSFIAVLIFVAFVFIVYRRNNSAANIQTEGETMIQEESPPPPYDRIHEVSSESEITTTVTEVKERSCLAIAYRNPTAAYYHQSAFPQLEDVIDNVYQPVEAPQDVDDEATMPSSWTPNASNSNVNEGDQELCSFSGLFTNTNTTEASTIQSNPLELNNETSGNTRQNAGEVAENQFVVNNAQQQSDEIGETRC